MYMQESILVSHAQAGSLQFKALALKAVYHKLLKGAPKRQAFEDTAEFFEVADSTLREWELSYRTKGHIQVRRDCSIRFNRNKRCACRRL